MAALDGVLDQTRFLGFADVDVGVAGQQMLKSSIAPYNVLDNVLKTFKAQNSTTKEVIIVAILYCPTVVLNAGATDIDSCGYANLGKGSIALCSNGIAVKIGDVGTDTWSALIAA